MSSSVEAIDTAGESSSTSASTTVPASRMPCIGDRGANRVAMRRLELGREVDVDPLRLADLGAKLLESGADLADLRVCELQSLEDRVLGDLVAAGLDHRERLARADDDEVERRLLELLAASG